MTKQMRAAGVGMLAWAATIGVAAQQRDLPHDVPPVPEAQQILLAAYPELREGRITWRVEGTPEGVVLAARRVTDPFAVEPPRAPALVSAVVALDEHGRLHSLIAGGTLLDTVRQQAATVARRRGDADEHLKAAGARFAPSDTEKVETLVPVGVQRLLAAPVVTDRTFRKDAPAETPAEAMTWAVELESSDAVPRRYTLIFEPIEGRLLSVVRR